MITTKKEAQEVLAKYGFEGTAAEIRAELSSYGITLGNANQSQSWIDAAEAVLEQMTAAVEDAEGDSVEAEAADYAAEQAEAEAMHRSIAAGEPSKTEDSPEALQKAASDELYEYLEAQVSEVAPEPTETLAIQEFPATTENLMKPWNLLGFIDTKRLLKGMQPKRQKPQGFGIPVHSNRGYAIKGIKSNRFYNVAMKVISGLKLREYRATGSNPGNLQTA